MERGPAPAARAGIGLSPRCELLGLGSLRRLLTESYPSAIIFSVFLGVGLGSFLRTTMHDSRQPRRHAGTPGPGTGWSRRKSGRRRGGTGERGPLSLGVFREENVTPPP